MSKKQLDLFSRILPKAQMVYVTNDKDQMITSRKINYLTQKLMQTDTEYALAFLNKKTKFPSDLTPYVRSFLLKEDHRKNNNKQQVRDLYPLKKELINSFICTQIILTGVEPIIPASVFFAFLIYLSVYAINKRFELDMLNNLNLPFELELHGQDDMCIQFKEDSNDDEPRASCFFK